MSAAERQGTIATASDTPIDVRKLCAAVFAGGPWSEKSLRGQTVMGLCGHCHACCCTRTRNAWARHLVQDHLLLSWAYLNTFSQHPIQNNEWGKKSPNQWADLNGRWPWLFACRKLMGADYNKGFTRVSCNSRLPWNLDLLWLFSWNERKRQILWILKMHCGGGCRLL